MGNSTVKLSIGKTYNLGNYESLRLDVGLEHRDIAIDHEGTELDAMSRWVTEQLGILARQLGIKNS